MAESPLLRSLKIKIEGNEEKINALKPFQKPGVKELPTICRVPYVFHKMCEFAYSPSIVAIGPLHRGKEHLQSMEVVKLSYMDFLFHRTGKYEQTRDDCVAAMLKKESLARRYYADDFRLHEDVKPAAELENSKTTGDGSCSSANQNGENARFAEMMLIDGCFMIDLFYRYYLEQNDAIVANAFKQTAVEHDLLMLENQLPFVVLEELFRLTVEQIPENCNCPRPLLTECVLSFFGDVLNLEEKPRSNEEKEEREKQKEEVLENFKYSATELDLGGIKFRQEEVNLRYHLSWLMIAYTELLLRNFIAFERSCPLLLVNPYFTSYAFLMDRLINTPDDVKLLEKAGIICNLMGSRQEVASLFHNLCKNITIDRLYSTKECLKVIKFHKHRCPRFQVKLRRDYFSNPWTIISVGAASVLFVLTLLQTIYTICSQGRPEIEKFLRGPR
ncbi:UPF0481 protein At3g47200-like [Cornus florida]|uniref:UPF0481 protein At3g47200-like n=1 Tax=Cornus florida TaxID=4283 RepID=UPI002897FB9C|nr:UPF0481 protein At3g47200-like [Cornus florida]